MRTLIKEGSVWQVLCIALLRYNWSDAMFIHNVSLMDFQHIYIHKTIPTTNIKTSSIILKNLLGFLGVLSSIPPRQQGNKYSFAFCAINLYEFSRTDLFLFACLLSFSITCESTHALYTHSTDTYYCSFPLVAKICPIVTDV